MYLFLWHGIFFFWTYAPKYAFSSLKPPTLNKNCNFYSRNEFSCPYFNLYSIMRYIYLNYWIRIRILIIISYIIIICNLYPETGASLQLLCAYFSFNIVGRKGRNINMGGTRSLLIAFSISTPFDFNFFHPFAPSSKLKAFFRYRITICVRAFFSS